MAGPFTEILKAALARKHPDACRESLEDVAVRLKGEEEAFGVVPLTAIRLARDYLVQDEQIHGGRILYKHHGGRVGDGENA